MAIKFVSIYNVTLAFGLLCATAGTEAATKYVNVNAVCANADGTLAKPFCTIQEAVNNAISGDTVRVAAGEYEWATVDKSLKLLGADARTTVIYGMDRGIYVTAGGVEIAYFTFRPYSNSNIGIAVYANSFHIHHCIFEGNQYGLHTMSSGTIHHCVFVGNQYGLVATTGANVGAFNIVTSSNTSSGLYTTRSPYSSVGNITLTSSIATDGVSGSSVTYSNCNCSGYGQQFSF